MGPTSRQERSVVMNGARIPPGPQGPEHHGARRRHRGRDGPRNHSRGQDADTARLGVHVAPGGLVSATAHRVECRPIVQAGQQRVHVPALPPRSRPARMQHPATCRMHDVALRMSRARPRGRETPQWRSRCIGIYSAPRSGDAPAPADGSAADARSRPTIQRLRDSGEHHGRQCEDDRRRRRRNP